MPLALINICTLPVSGQLMPFEVALDHGQSLPGSAQDMSESAKLVYLSSQNRFSFKLLRAIYLIKLTFKNLIQTSLHIVCIHKRKGH